MRAPHATSHRDSSSKDRIRRRGLSDGFDATPWLKTRPFETVRSQVQILSPCVFSEKPFGENVEGLLASNQAVPLPPFEFNRQRL